MHWAYNFQVLVLEYFHVLQPFIVLLFYYGSLVISYFSDFIRYFATAAPVFSPDLE